MVLKDLSLPAYPVVANTRFAIRYAAQSLAKDGARRTKHFLGTAQRNAADEMNSFWEAVRLGRESWLIRMLVRHVVLPLFSAGNVRKALQWEQPRALHARLPVKPWSAPMPHAP